MIELHSPVARKVRAIIAIAVVLLVTLWFAVTPIPSLPGFILAGAAILIVPLSWSPAHG